MSKKRIWVAVPRGNWASKILRLPWFEPLTGLVILLNSFVMFYDSAFGSLEGWDTSNIQWTEDAFLVIYILELALRFAGSVMVPMSIPILGKPGPDGETHFPLTFRLPNCLTDSWVKLDLTLVSSSIVVSWIMPLMDFTYGMGGFSPATLRTIRLLRIVRALRVLHKYEALYLLIQGLVNSFSTIVSVTCIIAVFIYMFGLLAIEFISVPALNNPDDYPEEYITFINDFFSTWWKVALTLLMFTCMDGASEVYAPMIHSLGSQRPFIGHFFVGFTLTFIFIVSIAFMNLVTAVIVEKAIESGQEEREVRFAREREAKEQHCADLRHLFEQMDDDGDHKLCLQELQTADISVKNKLSQVIGMGNITSKVDMHNFDREIAFLFNMLDADGAGWLDVDEFVEGLLRITDGSVQNDRNLIMRIEKLCSSMSAALGIVPRGQWRKKWKEHAVTLEGLFDTMDEDGNGLLSREKFNTFMQRSLKSDSSEPGTDAERTMLQLFRPLSIDQEDLENLFETIDVDSNGQLSKAEFMEAFSHLADCGVIKDKMMMRRIAKLLAKLVEEREPIEAAVQPAVQPAESGAAPCADPDVGNEVWLCSARPDAQPAAQPPWQRLLRQQESMLARFDQQESALARLERQQSMLAQLVIASLERKERVSEE
jgi:Ca2+-binding EF-hand superfamily protein